MSSLSAAIRDVRDQAQIYTGVGSSPSRTTRLTAVLDDTHAQKGQSHHGR